MEKINILMSADNKYAPWLGVTLYSVIKTTHTPVEVHIASHSISEENKQKLLGLETDLVKINIFEIDNSLFKDCPVNERLPLASYVRLFASQLFPKHSKMLWLDCDILVQSDLNELWQTKLDGYAIAAVKDFNSDAVNKYFGFSDGFCINSGVLLMNLDFMRLKGIQDIFIKTMLTKKDLIRFGDQCVINMALHNEILELPQKYNSARKRHKNDVIIHFIWDKPWDFSKVDNYHNVYKDRFFRRYWNMVRKSPWMCLWKKYKKEYYSYNLKIVLEKIQRVIYSVEKSSKNTKYKLFLITIIKKDKMFIRLLGVPIIFYKNRI